MCPTKKPRPAPPARGISKEKPPGPRDKLAAWMHDVDQAGATETLFLFESYLRGVRAFFAEGQEGASSPADPERLDRDFEPELMVVSESLTRIEGFAKELVRRVHQGPRDLIAQIEAQVLREKAIEHQAGRISEALSPRESLAGFVDACQDLLVILSLLTDTGRIDLKGFLCIQRILEREIRSRRYVDLLLSQRFRPQFDRVENAGLNSLLKSIGDERVRHSAAFCFLCFFRSLRYLALIIREQEADRPLPSSLVLLSLVNEELSIVAEFIRGRLSGSGELKAGAFEAADIIRFSIRSEAGSLHRSKCLKVLRSGDARGLGAAVDEACGILQNCIHGCTFILVKALDPAFDTSVLFPSAGDRAGNSMRVREDLWDLRQFFKELLKTTQDPSIEMMIEQVARFRENSMKHLLYRDHENFDRFSDDLFSAPDKAAVFSLVRQFVGYLETLVHEISKRSALVNADPLSGQ
jgi:hypothetical protein